jgi:hypothetical protein
MEKYKCDICKKELKEIEDCVKHATKKHHYSFELKGSKLHLAILGK